MRIVHVADSFAPDIGGIERQVETLARRQVADGHDVTVITAVAEPAEMDLDVVRALSGRWLTVAFPWRNRRRVAQVLDGRPVDVVHAHFTVVSPMAVYVTRAASRRGIPIGATVHSLWWQVTAATRLTSLPFGWGRMNAAWSGVSLAAATRVRRTMPRAGTISVVPNVVDVDWWRPRPGEAQAVGNDLRVILVGRLKKRKHVDEFIDIFDQARARLAVPAKVRVDIVGEGPRREDLQRQINRRGLADSVFLLGHREPHEVRRLLHSSHLFVAPSRQESFGIAALEARAAGLPVLGYTGNGLADFIEDSVEGLLAHDAAHMARLLARLLQDQDELGRLRAITQARRPSVNADQAMGSVYELYRRAQAMHRRVGTTTTHQPPSPAS